MRGAPDSTELAAVLLALLSLARPPDGDAGRAAGPRPRALWRPGRGWRPPGSWTAP